MSAFAAVVAVLICLLFGLAAYGEFAQIGKARDDDTGDSGVTHLVRGAASSAIAISSPVLVFVDSYGVRVTCIVVTAGSVLTSILVARKHRARDS